MSLSTDCIGFTMKGSFQCTEKLYIHNSSKQDTVNCLALVSSYKLSHTRVQDLNSRPQGWEASVLPTITLSH